MKKFSLLQQALLGAAALTAGFCIYYSFFKATPAAANKMIMLPAETINNDTIETSGLTPIEKEELFFAALGYRGGANPPDFMLQEFREKSAQALQKIMELGLQAEYDLFEADVNNQPSRP